MKNIEVLNRVEIQPPQILSGIAALATLLILFTTGCGVSGISSDPLAKNARYKQMEKNGVPISHAQVLTPPPPPPAPPAPKVNVQTVMNAIFPEPDLNGQVLNFVEGETSTYRMTIRVLQPGIKYSINAQGLPKDAKFGLVAGSRDVYELTWAPRIGSAQGKSVFISKFRVALNVTSTDTPETAKLIDSITKEHEIPLIIAGGHSLPLIEKLDIASNTIEEGSKIAFTVFVTDAVSQSKGVIPDVTVVSDSSAATFERPVLSNVTRYVHVNRQGRAVDGGFVFDGEFDASNVLFPDKTTQLDARFVVIAMNDQARSPGKLAVLTITKKSIAPLAPVAPPFAAPSPAAPSPATPIKPLTAVAVKPAAKAVTKKKVPTKKTASKATTQKTTKKSTLPHAGPVATAPSTKPADKTVAAPAPAPATPVTSDQSAAPATAASTGGQK